MLYSNNLTCSIYIFTAIKKLSHRFPSSLSRFNFHGLGCHPLAVASCGMRPGSLGVNFHRTFCRGNPKGFTWWQTQTNIRKHNMGMLGYHGIHGIPDTSSTQGITSLNFNVMHWRFDQKVYLPQGHDWSSPLESNKAEEHAYSSEASRSFDI